MKYFCNVNKNMNCQSKILYPAKYPSKVKTKYHLRSTNMERNNHTRPALKVVIIKILWAEGEVILDSGFKVQEKVKTKERVNANEY